MTAPAERKWMQILHIAKKECGLDDDSYRAILLGVAGVDSSSGIKTWKQYNDCLSAFKKLGFRVQSGSKANQKGTLKETEGQEGRHNAFITAKQEYYIRGLWDLASKEKSLRSLNRFVVRLTGVSSVTWLKKENASKVINALRDLAEKAGYDPDKPPERKQKKEG